MDELYARLESLKARKAVLEQSVAPLLKEYAVHTEGLPLHRMQVSSMHISLQGSFSPVRSCPLHGAVLINVVHVNTNTRLYLLAQQRR